MASYQARFKLSKAEWLLTEALLSDIFPALTVKPVIEGDPHSDEEICLIFPEAPERDGLIQQLDAIFSIYGLSLPEITIEALPDIDWLAHVYEQLKPIEAGRFFVHGSHVAEQPPAGKIPVLIEAATAFGTGEHPTTKGCLLAFNRLLDQASPNNILDMGCGSGILAIAAALTLPDATILGIDIDAQSVAVTRNHARDNHVADRIDLIAGDGFHDPQVAARAPYDLVFANILAQPLIEMADALCATASRDVILSGFTRAQEAYVAAPYIERGLTVLSNDAIDDWVTLWLQRI